jgi:hypothetical protein
MHPDPELTALLDGALKSHEIDVGIETGTYLGLGSTRFVAECFLRTKPPKTYVTMENNFNHWSEARQNLRDYLFVDCRWGCSIDCEQAIAFMLKDDAINRHENYPDIFIDTLDDPLKLYLDEIKGSINGTDNPKDADLMRLWSGENLLPKYLELHRNNKPLIVMDSIAGCGFYEFQVMMDVMKDAPFLVLLDDIHHIKHFRSFDYMKSDPRFHILGHSLYHGWVLAWHE